MLKELPSLPAAVVSQLCTLRILINFDLAPSVTPDKETLLKDASTVKALIGNPGYPKLHPACDLLEGVRRLTQSFQKDGALITPPVPPSVTKAAKQAVVEGIECVSITFAVYLIEHQLPSEKTLVNRTKTVDDFVKSRDKQGVVLGGRPLKISR